MFETLKDANAVADCLNNIFQNDYFHVIGTYKMVGHIGRGKYVDDVLEAVVTNKEDIPREKQNAIYRSAASRGGGRSSKIQSDGQIHVMRYKLNDVMPTMNLDDYDMETHKEKIKTVIAELHKYPHSRHTKNIISELEYMPPSKALKSGGIHYQNLVSDPEFQERWYGK